MNSKKLFASVIAVAMAVTVVPGLGQAQTATAEDLAAQIQQLQAQLAGLQGQLGETPATGTSSSAPAACAGITFSRNLTLGANGTDVKCLQALLNTDPTTAVAVTGVGSAGNETMTFGGLTKAAVIAFQNKYASEVLAPVGLTAGTGFVGASTRAKLNAMLAGGTVIGGGETTGNLPEGCTSTTGYSTTTGLPCSTSTTLPQGCTSTTGYSPVTGQACSGTTTTGTGLTQTGEEGTITATVNPAPANNTKVYEGDSKVAVYGLKIKATGSDMDVQRVTLKFSKQPWTFFSNLYLYDGDTQIATAALSSSTVSKLSSSDYEITLTGFASKVIVPNNTTKVLTVKVDVNSSVSSDAYGTGNTSTTIVVKAASGSSDSVTTIRAVDQAGLNQYSGEATGRTVSVNQSQSTSASLSVNVNSSTPKSHIIVADSNQAVDKANVLIFDVKATKDTLLLDTIDDVTFTDADCATDAADSDGYRLPSTVYLGDDAQTVIGTASAKAAAGYAACNKYKFEDLNYTIARDVTKTFTIKVDDTLGTPNTTTRIAASPASDGMKYKAVVNASSITAEKTNGSTVTTLSGSATSYDMIVYSEGPVFTLSGISTTANQAAYNGATSTLSATFNVQVAATTGDVYIGNSTVGAFAVHYGEGNVDSGATGVSTTYTQPSGTTTSGNYFRVTQGTTATFAVAATYTRAGAAGVFYDLRMASITWRHIAAGADVVSNYMDNQAEWISQQIALN